MFDQNKITGMKRVRFFLLLALVEARYVSANHGVAKGDNNLDANGGRILLRQGGERDTGYEKDLDGFGGRMLDHEANDETMVCSQTIHF